jgi:hypothetical protein
MLISCCKDARELERLSKTMKDLRSERRIEVGKPSNERNFKERGELNIF